MLTDYGIVGITQDGAPVPPPTFYKMSCSTRSVKCKRHKRSDSCNSDWSNSFSYARGTRHASPELYRVGRASIMVMQLYRRVSLAHLIFEPTCRIDSDAPSLRPFIRISPCDSVLRWKCGENRRKIELSGVSWTIEPNGHFVGYNGNYWYHYAHSLFASNRYSVAAFLQNQSSALRNLIRQSLSFECD